MHRVCSGSHDIMSETYVKITDEQTVVDKKLFASLIQKRDHANALAKESARRRYHEDPDFKKRHYESSYASFKRKLANDPAYREKYNADHRKYYRAKKSLKTIPVDNDIKTSDHDNTSSS